MTPLKIVVFGTPQISADIFSALHALPTVQIVGAITMPDRPAKRGLKAQPSAVATWADAAKIPTLKPEKIDSTVSAQITAWGAERGIVVAYGKLFAKDFLADAPPLWNLHYSLLPLWRGATPVQSAIAAGDKIGGVSVFEIAAGMDAGDIFAQQKLSLEKLGTIAAYQKMNTMFVSILTDLFAKLANGEKLNGTTQNHANATFCSKLSKSDGALDPQQISADEFLNKLRAYEIWPQITLQLSGKSIKIKSAQRSSAQLAAGEIYHDKYRLSIGCKQGAVDLLELQAAGKKPLAVADFLRGFVFTAAS